VRALAIVAAVTLAACASAPPPRPPPFAGAPPGPPAELGAAPSDSSLPAAAESGSTAPASTAVANLGGEVDSAPPSPMASPRIVVEDAFKLGAEPIPKTKDAYKAWIADKRHWNDGGLGALVADPPEDGTHPMPRVILTVTKVSGPHSSAEIQRLLRRNHWMEVIQCYRLGAYKDQRLRGDTRIEASVTSAGVIEGGRVVSTKLDDAEVARCFAATLKKHPMPRAKRRSRMTLTIHVSPGDEPMPPPPDVLTPGDGELDLAEARDVVRTEVPRFAACYERARLYAPDLFGRIAIRFHVTAEGKLDEAFETESRFPDERMLRCVLRRARGLAFPKPKGGDVRFVVPLRFSMGDERASNAEDSQRGGEAGRD
jgi:hypothetical protein